MNFISLGCPKNLVDSEVMLGMLDQNNFVIQTPEQNSNVTVINTCGFVEDSKQESIDTILEITERKKRGECDMVVVTGCLSQRYAEDLPKLMPEVDLFVGTRDYDQLPKLIRDRINGKGRRVLVESPFYVPDDQAPRIQTTPKHFKYVKIAEGCSHRCSFCIIPHIRGDLHSRTVGSIKSEIQAGVANGVKEFNLISQDLNEYGRDLAERSSLFKLLTELGDISGDHWIRLMYLYPLQFPKKLVELIARQPNIVKYVDIPLQHITDRMLKIMNRGSAARYIHQLIDLLRTAMPEIVIRTTFIVGHPGETKKDFQALKKFIKDSAFDRVGVFKYSVEEGTPAATRDDQVDDATKDERWHELMTLQNKISLKKNRALIGKTLKAIYEGPSEESEYLGSARYYGQAPQIDGQILIRDGEAKIGEFCNVKIVDAFEYDLLGEIQTTNE